MAGTFFELCLFDVKFHMTVCRLSQTLSHLFADSELPLSPYSQSLHESELLNKAACSQCLLIHGSGVQLPDAYFPYRVPFAGPF